MSTHEQVDELLAGFALGSATPDETAMVRRHLGECEVCSANLARLIQAAGTLPLGVDEVQPAASLRAAVLAIPSTTSARERLPQSRPRILGRVPLPPTRQAYAWAAAAVLVVGLSAWNVTLQRQLGHTSSQLAELQHQVQHATMAGGSGGGTVTYLASDEIAFVTLHSLAQPGADKEYQLWVIRDGRAESAGVFLPESDGSKLLVVTRALNAGDVVAVTVGPTGGTAQPVAAPIITGKI